MAAPGKILFLVSKPGSGATTQGELLAESASRRGIKTQLLSPGDLLREAISKGDPLHRNYPYAMAAQEAVKQGDLASDAPIVDMLKNEIVLAEQEGVTNFVICGFPRTHGQIHLIKTLREEISTIHDESHVRFLHIRVTDGTAIERVEGRAMLAGNKVRGDDNKIWGRLDVYRVKTEPAINELRGLNLLTTVTTDGLKLGETSWLLEQIYGDWLGSVPPEEPLWGRTPEMSGNHRMRR